MSAQVPSKPRIEVETKKQVEMVPGSRELKIHVNMPSYEVCEHIGEYNKRSFERQKRK